MQATELLCSGQAGRMPLEKQTTTLYVVALFFMNAAVDSQLREVFFPEVSTRERVEIAVVFFRSKLYISGRL